MTEKSRIVNQWCVYFEKGRDFDSWGQLVEAAEEYSRCVSFELFMSSFVYCALTSPEVICHINFFYQSFLSSLFLS